MTSPDGEPQEAETIEDQVLAPATPGAEALPTDTPDEEAQDQQSS